MSKASFLRFALQAEDMGFNVVFNGYCYKTLNANRVAELDLASLDGGGYDGVTVYILDREGEPVDHTVFWFKTILKTQSGNKDISAGRNFDWGDNRPTRESIKQFVEHITGFLKLYGGTKH